MNEPQGAEWQQYICCEQLYNLAEEERKPMERLKTIANFAKCANLYIRGEK